MDDKKRKASITLTEDIRRRLSLFRLALKDKYGSLGNVTRICNEALDSFLPPYPEDPSKKTEPITVKDGKRKAPNLSRTA